MSSIVSLIGYHLVDTYNASNWFTKFDTLAIPDPTHGSVEYVSYNEAKLDGLAAIKNNQVYMGVDYKTNGLGTTKGRKSMRVSSRRAYTKGLFVADIEHMPASSKNGCGLWPAWWTFGPHWPHSGEIDIIEGVNSNTGNQMTLHTSDGCLVENTGSARSTIFNVTEDADCEGFNGCPQITPDTTSYGQGFNAIHGGVYAMEWTDTAIAVWFFHRHDARLRGLLDDVAPDPVRLGTPRARFTGPRCDFASHFRTHNIIFDTTFCGDWAEPNFQADPACNMLAPTCQAYVADNAADFAEAYWLVNSIRVFQTRNSSVVENPTIGTRAAAPLRARHRPSVPRGRTLLNSWF
ncbi:hypothetical protein P8C59_003611 [Phyllachora maydis]|uniref:GH16 domain-containing protein n=1 Tax=Phyllachora maydis TaxID=1825666 RepID=A0AAD9MDI4_9PEZI|nr:hypothetical protein P8C59_003611 [Phyllachora maydis]